MKGDIMFFKKTDTFISKTIAKMTNSEYTHVALIVAYDELSNVATIIEADKFIKTRIRRLRLDENMHSVFSIDNLTCEEKDRIVKYSFELLNTDYDYTLILNIFVSLIIGGKRQFFNNANKLICSELIDIAYYKAGVERKGIYPIGSVTPQELLEVYDLKA